MLALVSCASLELPPPTDSKSTLLVLPASFESTSVHSGPMGFHYVYEIESEDGAEVSYQAVFSRPMPGDMLIVDSLPPGGYRLKALSFVPAGGGDHRYGNNRQLRKERFRLEAGKITVFEKRLEVRRYNSIPGRGMSMTYAHDFPQLGKQENAEIITALSEQPNFDKWEFQYISPIVAHMLATEAVGTPPAKSLLEDPDPVYELEKTATTHSSVRVSGRYRSNITSQSHYIFPSRYRNAEITISQSGSRIRGHDESGGFEIEGTIEGGVIQFSLQPTIVTGHYHVTGEWKIDDNGRKLTGSWNDSRGDGPSEWELTRIE